jgi:putative superfamily III holin-X
MIDQQKDEASAAELFTTLARDTSILVKTEVQLAAVEMTQKARDASSHLALVGAGGGLALAGLLALMTAAIAALAMVIPVWMAALLVGSLVAVVGYVMVHTGLERLRRLSPVPKETVKTLKDDAIWAKEQLR